MPQNKTYPVQKALYLTQEDLTRGEAAAVELGTSFTAYLRGLLRADLDCRDQTKAERLNEATLHIYELAPKPHAYDGDHGPSKLCWWCYKPQDDELHSVKAGA